MDYSTVALRQEAYRSVLAGPDRLGDELAERLPALRRLRAEYEDARPVTELPPSVGRLTLRPDAATPPSGARALLTAGRRFARHLVVPPRTGKDVAVSAADARWWTVSALDSAFVQAADRRSYTHHIRDLAAFRGGLLATGRTFVTLWRRWPGLGRDYRSALPRLTGSQTWQRLLGLDAGH
jgi:galactofuranosylgalactofuranosylrhamnosyl-N-acetylglucosaminyl-diphospho-decaprenol beta-1,5/1,6-galactofuranosyltransferase